MARKYSNHHVQSFAVGQYVAANISRLDHAATDNNRILYRNVDIAGSKEQTWVQASMSIWSAKGDTSNIRTGSSQQPYSNLKDIPSLLTRLGTRSL